jgi:hypothetical protein
MILFQNQHFQIHDYPVKKLQLSLRLFCALRASACAMKSSLTDDGYGPIVDAISGIVDKSPCAAEVVRRWL